MKAFLMGQVHDEILVEFHKKLRKEVQELVVEACKNPDLSDYGLDPFPIKLRGSVGIGKNWLSTKKNEIKF